MFRLLISALVLSFGLAFPGESTSSEIQSSITAPIPGLVSVHCPKSRYSQSAAIAHAQGKYPGYRLHLVRDLTNVWVVVLKN